MTAFGGARDESSAFCWTVGAESSMEEGANMNALAGRQGHESGIALRVSEASAAVRSSCCCWFWFCLPF